jgi:hypothetical protein
MASNKIKPRSLENSFTEFLLYKAPSGAVKVEIFLKNENIWLTQEKIAMLFGVDRSVITKHLKNIFEIVGFETIECIIDERWSEGRGCLLTGIFKKK